MRVAIALFLASVAASSAYADLLVSSRDTKNIWIIRCGRHANEIISFDGRTRQHCQRHFAPRPGYHFRKESEFRPRSGAGFCGAPGFIALWQVNAVVPLDAPTGNLDLVLTVNNVASNTTNFPVKR